MQSNMRRGVVFAALGTFLAWLLVSCADSGSNPSGPSYSITAEPVQADETLDRPLGGLETRFREIESYAPGFAGFYIDRGTGDLVMRLADMSRQSQVAPHAELEADRHLRSDGSRRNLRYEPAQFAFSQLRGFRGAMYRHASDFDVVYFDIDEVQNKLVIGVASERALQPLLDVALKSGIPSDGISIGVTSRATVDRAVAGAAVTHFHGSLGSHQDTLIGGLIVKIDGGNGTCTAWIPATSGSTKVFATASHCDEDGIFELNTSVDMGHHLSSHDAGYEWKDPDPIGQNPAFRWSDMALYEVVADSVEKHQRGWFARTTNQSGSTTFADSVPVLSISGEVSPYPVVGDTVHRVSQKNGWRVGEVVRNGVDWPDWDGSGVYLYDQDDVLMVGDPGDSGAPYVVYTGGLWKIAGIHVGSRDGDTSVFSAMWNIEEDMGNLSTLGLPRIE